jgi:hypothetical protein
MVYFQTKNPKLGKFWRVLQWKILVYFTDNRSIFLPLDIFYGRFGIFCGNLVSFPRFGKLYQEKSGNPGRYRGMATRNQTFYVRQSFEPLVPAYHLENRPS